MRGTITLLLLLSVAACDDDGPFTPLSPDARSALRASVPPADLVTIVAGAASLSLWPYTGADFSGTAQDPINLVFTGRADPRAVRSALFALSGDRTTAGLPNVAPFNCTWTDAIGDLQTAWNASSGWVGSALQLACGSFGPIRIHVRLFQAGAVTLGNAHFELLIPGTTDHQVLSWELAEQLVTIDMVRSGLLAAPPGSSGVINGAPGFRQIPAQIYNLLPADLKAVIGGPAGTVGSAVGIATNGSASVFDLGGTAPAAGGTEQRFTVAFDQIIPRPFCASGPGDYLQVRGPVDLSKVVRLDGAGGLHSEFEASGRLRLTPVDPATGSPTGPSYEAEVKDHQVTRFDDRGGEVTGMAMQMELPQNVAGRGRKTVRLKVGPGGVTQFDLDVVCHP
ncbi:MAG: hypothetical protein ABJC36_14060 [Gemmatimonadales bacterium]